jgi:eukaryotic-like serine/threonine-protein kinase
MTPDSSSKSEEETWVVSGQTRRSHEAGGSTLVGERTGPAEGSRVGRYVVLEQAGEGGMGVVVRAYDPKLRREVALKLMRTGGGPEGQARMLREAQALARLSDPHVVAVYDAEVTEHGVCIAMEYVEGHTLGRWLGEQKRGWQEVLNVVVAMARGLASAHAAGLVHRDVKPANVLVGTDGRVRLTDFGIARAGENGSAGGSSVDGVAEPGLQDLTQAGTVLGTPAYMAPEQHVGKRADARADQYALCVVAWEGLYGQRPFRKESTVGSLREAKLRGPPARPASRVPVWLHTVLVRGLAVEPDGRWPSMETLVEALLSGQSRSRRRRAGLGVGLVASVVAATLTWQGWQRARQVAACEQEGESIAEVWNDETRETLRGALTGTGVSHAEETAKKVMPWLDGQARAWQDARTQACLEARVQGSWDLEVLDRSRWCLDEHRMELEALVTELSRGEGKGVEKAVSAAAGLAGVAGCRDAARLARLPAPPTARQAELALVRAELSKAQALEHTGAYEEGLETARRALERAEAFEWPPLSVEIRIQLGRLLERTGDPEGAAEALETAFFEASKAGASEAVVHAADRLVYTVGHRLARHEEGRRWARHAEVMLATLPDPTGTMLAAHYSSLANVLYAAGEPEEAVALHERALDIRENALGPEHPDVAESLDNLANVHFVTRGFQQAKVLHERALEIRENGLGTQHPRVAESLNNLAGVHLATGGYEEAKALLERALAIRDQALGPEHPDVAANLHNLGMVYQATGGHEEAKARFERSLTISEKVFGPEHSHVARILQNLAAVHHNTKDYEQAKARFERALAIHENVHGPEHPQLISSLIGLAEVALAQDENETAVMHSRRALSLSEAAAAASIELARARFMLARSLWAAKRDRSQALVLAGQARDGYREAGPSFAESLAQVDAWLEASAVHR